MRLDGVSSLLCRARTFTCALPLDVLAETMRALPIEPIAGAPAFILGVSIIRGEVVPVIDAGRLLTDTGNSTPTRFVTLKVGERHVALAVDAVLGVRELARHALETLPPLLQGAGAVASIAALDEEVVLALRTGRLVPDDVWIMIEQKSSSS